MNDLVLASSPPAMPGQDIVQMHSYKAEDDYETLIMIAPFGVLAVWLIIANEPNAAVYGAAICIATLFIWGLCEWIYASRIKRFEQGSYFDLRNKQIVWWHGTKPAAREIIDADAVAEVLLDYDDDGGLTLYLCRTTGERIEILFKCMKKPEAWAARLHHCFPNIAVKRSFCRKPLPEHVQMEKSRRSLAQRFGFNR